MSGKKALIFDGTIASLNREKKWYYFNITVYFEYKKEFYIAKFGGNVKIKTNSGKVLFLEEARQVFIKKSKSIVTIKGVDYEMSLNLILKGAYHYSEHCRKK